MIVSLLRSNDTFTNVDRCGLLTLPISANVNTQTHCEGMFHKTHVYSRLVKAPDQIDMAMVSNPRKNRRENLNALQ